MKTKNKHGRVGAHRRRPTTNQELKAEVQRLRKAVGEGIVSPDPDAQLYTAREVLGDIVRATEGSRASAAKDANRLARLYLES